MGDFKFARAALAGFELLRRRPIAGLALVLVGALISFGGRITVVANAHFQLFGKASPIVQGVYSTLFMSAVTGLAIAIVGAGVARLAPRADGRAAGPRLGADEARLFLLTLLVFPGLFIVAFVALIGSVIGAATGVVGSRLDMLIGTGAAIGGIVAFGLASRLWAAGVMTTQADAMRLRAAWRLSGRRPWKIFAVFCLATLVGLLIGIGGNVALNEALGKLPAMGWTAYLPLRAALKSSFHPLQLAHLGAQGLLFGLGLFLQAAPATVILDALVENRASGQAAVFD